MDNLPKVPTQLISPASLKNSGSQLLKTLVGVVNLETARILIQQGSSKELHDWLMAKRRAVGTAITRVEMAAILARLALHYVRPDFNQTHVDLIVDDFMDELAGANLEMIRDAARCWLREPDNRFFPTPGGLLQYCEADIRQRRKDVAALDSALEMLDGAA